MSPDAAMISAGELAGLDRLHTPIWIYDPDKCVRYWANLSAVRLWGADSLEDLLKDETPMVSSPAIRQRLQTLMKAIEDGNSCSQRWSFYPDHAEAFTTDCTFQAVRIPDPDVPAGRKAMLIEARPVETEVSAAERRSVEALRHTDVMVTLYDRDWTPLVRNPAAVAVFGTGASALCMPATMISPHDRARLEQAAQDRTPFAAVVDVVTLAGTRIHQIDARPTLDPATGQPCILVSETDTTGEVEARRANDSKSIFLANMSHELRTPLNAIVGYGELVLEQVQDGQIDDCEEDLGQVLRSARHLTSLIDDLLDLTTIEAGRLELAMQDVALSPVIDDCKAWLAADLAKQRNTLRLDGDSVQVSADPVRLRQILLKLLSNACKFTEDGEIVLAWSSENGRLRLQVSDTGCGIAAEAVPFLFDKFTQADDSSTRKVDGAGLGLAIGRDLAVSMGGDLTVHSLPGVGSTFTLWLASTQA